MRSLHCDQRDRCVHTAHTLHLSIIVTRFILNVCWKRTLWEGEDHSWIRVVCTATTGFDVRNATHYLRLAIRTGIDTPQSTFFHMKVDVTPRKNNRTRAPVFFNCGTETIPPPPQFVYPVKNTKTFSQYSRQKCAIHSLIVFNAKWKPLLCQKPVVNIVIT